MKKFVFSCLIFLGICQLYGQVQSGEIIYKVKIPSDFEQTMDVSGIEESYVQNIFRNIYENAKKASPFIVFNLYFNQNNAVGSSIKGMNSDSGVDFLDALETVYAFGEYVIDFKGNSSTHQFEDGGRLIRVKRDLGVINWLITDETKEVAGFLCLKATAQYSFNYMKENEIVAWFTPDLPVQVGPIGIGGLPGAILELEKQNFTYYATSVKENKKVRELHPSQEGQLLSAEEYQDMLRQRRLKILDSR